MQEEEVTNTLKEAGKTYISLETNLQEEEERTLFMCETLVGLLPQEKGFLGSDKNLNVADLDRLLSTACSDVKKKIDEIHTYKSKLLETYNSFLKKESERHTEEMDRKLKELYFHEQSIENCKSTLHKNQCMIDNLSEALLAQKNKFHLYKAFHAWKKYCVDSKRDKFLYAIAAKHHKEKLIRKIFCCWHELTEWNWKERIEHSVRFNIRECQRSLVEEYESKIKNIENELKQSQIKIDTLESNHKFYEDTMKQALLRGVCALNMETLSIFRSSPELNSQPSSTSLPADKASLQSEEINPKPCPECTWSPSENSSEIIMKYSSPGKESCNDGMLSRKLHKTQHISQPVCLPVMGTTSVTYEISKQKNKNTADSETNFCCHKRNVCVQRHITKSSSNAAVMKNAKSRELVSRRPTSK